MCTQFETVHSESIQTPSAFPHFVTALLFYPLFPPRLIVTVLSYRCNSHKDSGEAKVESRASPETKPHQCVGGNTVHLAPVLACTAPGPPQESLVHNGTRTSLTRTTLGQLCVASWVSRSQPAAAHPSIRNRICSNTTSTAVT